jgi:hypothetical protein
MRRILLLIICLFIAAYVMRSSTNAAAELPAQTQCGGELNCAYIYALYRCDNATMRPPRVTELFVRFADITTPEPDFEDYRLVLESQGNNSLLYSVLVTTVLHSHHYEARLYQNGRPVSDWILVQPPTTQGFLYPSNSCGQTFLPIAMGR